MFDVHISKCHMVYLGQTGPLQRCSSHEQNADYDCSETHWPLILNRLPTNPQWNKLSSTIWCIQVSSSNINRILEAVPRCQLIYTNAKLEGPCSTIQAGPTEVATSGATYKVSHQCSTTSPHVALLLYPQSWPGAHDHSNVQWSAETDILWQCLYCTAALTSWLF